MEPITYEEKMSEEQFKQVLSRFECIEENMVKKSYIYQVMLTVQSFMLGVIVLMCFVVGLG